MEEEFKYITQNVIDSWFETGDFPTAEQFKASWRSFWHKGERIPMTSIEGLNAQFQGTATIQMLGNYAKKDASNLTDEDVPKFRQKLAIVSEINLP